MLGSVGFNWQLGSLATGWGQGGVRRGGEAGEPEAERSDLFFFLTSAHQRMIDLSEPIIISLALSAKAEFRPFPALKDILPLHRFSAQLPKSGATTMQFPYTSCKFPPSGISSSLPGYCHDPLSDFTKDSTSPETCPNESHPIHFIISTYVKTPPNSSNCQHLNA